MNINPSIHNKYCVASRFFEGGIFHELHEPIAIRENFTLEMFTESIYHWVILIIHEFFLLEKLEYTNLWKISPWK